jgi:CheY-like chemotaxis protein
MKQLGELLVEAGVIDAKALQDALAQPTDHRIGSRLFALGLAHERSLCEALARQGHPALVLSESRLDLRALQCVPREIAHRHSVLPVAVSDDTLVVATPDANDTQVFGQIAFSSGREVQPLLSLQLLLERTIPLAYDAAARGDATLAGSKADPSGPPLALVRDVPPPLELIEPAAPDPAGWDLPETDHGLPPLVAVIEDEPEVRSLLRRALERDGCRVVEAATGTEGMQLLKGERPRVILLDAMLPGIHGFELCRLLKQSERYKGVPVVMISAHYTGWQSARDIYELYGADEFIEKPFNVHMLRKKIATLVGNTLDRTPINPQLAARIDELTVVVDGHKLAGRGAELAECVERWLKLVPFDGRAHLEHAHVLRSQGDVDGARRALETATTLLPESFRAWQALASIYDRLGFSRRAVSAWSEALGLAPDPAIGAQIELRLQRG